EAVPPFSQHCDLRLALVLKAEEVFANFYGIQFREDRAARLAHLPLEARLRFQWVHRGGPRPLLFSVRLLAATPQRQAPLPLKLGDLAIGIDVAPAVQELLVDHLNRAYLHTGRPAVPGDLSPEDVAKAMHVVRETPLAGFAPSQLYIQDGWLVLTLTSKAAGRDGPPAGARKPELPADARVLFDARGRAATVTRQQFFTLIRDAGVEKRLAQLLPEKLPPFSLALRLHQGQAPAPAAPAGRDVRSLADR